MNIARTDKNGIQLKEGDIVAECTVGDLIWEGRGVVEQRPLGIVTILKKHNSSNLINPEETDCYNIFEIRHGCVRLTDKADVWMTKNLSENGKTTLLHISRYDGRFYAWDNIERVGSVYDFPN